jgi:hypothetical protein
MGKALMMVRLLRDLPYFKHTFPGGMVAAFPPQIALKLVQLGLAEHAEPIKAVTGPQHKRGKNENKANNRPLRGADTPG